MKTSRLVVALVISLAAAGSIVGLSARRVSAVGKPGLTIVPCPTQDWIYDDPTFGPLIGAQAFSGRYDGGTYQIEIPDKWNGELMLSAHGFTTNGGERGSHLRVRPPAIREQLIHDGYAWAASSYRCNGYVPGAGLEDTMKLTELFTRFNNGTPPRRVYLTGTSMGGHVTLLGAHEFPETFAGALAMCPSGPELFDYTTAVGAAAEVVTGLTFTSPSEQREVTRQMAAILGDDTHFTEKGQQLASIEIQLSGGPRPFAAEGLETRFLENISGSALAGNQSPSSRAVTNRHYTYAIDPGLGLTSEALQSKVRRKDPDMSVRGPEGPYDELMPFDGNISRPLLTMHGTGDLFVPIHLERTLNRAVMDAGKNDLLVQRIYRIPGHCRFSEDEQWQAFQALVRWVREGVKPEGDDIFADFKDAGRKFTTPLREGDPGHLTVGR